MINYFNKVYAYMDKRVKVYEDVLQVAMAVLVLSFLLPLAYCATEQRQRPCGVGAKKVMKPGIHVRSLIECAVRCSHDRCSSVEYDDVTGECSLYVMDNTCSVSGEEVKHQHMYSPSYADCLSLYQDGENTDGVYTLQPSTVTSFPAFCDMQTGGWTVIQRRVDDTVDFNSTIAEYEAGFGDPTGNVWIGLIALHQLSLLPGTMEMEVYVECAYSVWTGTAKYGDVYVDGAQQNYRLSTDCASDIGADMQDYLFEADGKEFSIWDNDNVPDKNCAGGWWYGTTCGMSDLNGPYDKLQLSSHVLKLTQIKARHVR